MKNLIVGCFLAFALSLSFTNKAYATKIHLDFEVTSTDGCTYHIEGDVDFNFWTRTIESYDVVVTDCHGNKIHFIGIVINSNNNGENNDCNDYNIQESVVVIADSSSPIDKCFVFDSMKEYIYSNY